MDAISAPQNLTLPIESYKTMRVNMCLLETMELSLDRDNRTIPRYSLEWNQRTNPRFNDSFWVENFWKTS